MQNLAALSRAELIGALLAPVLPKDHPHADQVNDLESAYFGAAAVATEASDTLLDHKLGVARELLMRDLRAHDVDMLTIVIIGSRQSRIYQRGDGSLIAYTPRGYGTSREERT